MNLAKIFSTQFDYLKSFVVEIEVDLTKSGFTPSFKIVGLPDKAVEESKERVLTALKNTNLINAENSKVIVSLSPAEKRKTGPIFDLGIAMAYLLADGRLDFNFENKIFIGELALDGSLRAVQGILPMVKLAKEKGFTSVYLPDKNFKEASLIQGINIFPVKNLNQLVEHLEQEKAEKKNLDKIIKPLSRKISFDENKAFQIDFSDIRGQESAKRALEIAAAGGHNIMLYGPPGTGKTMLAKAFSEILPDLNYNEIVEVSSIHSISGELDGKSYISKPPFRAPHHTSSYVSIIGGGSTPKAGEITLAHKGVLFMDEFVEFDKRVLESLREPLEEQKINISRSKGSYTFPADFILIGALNPPSTVLMTSRVSYAEEQKFKKKLSGPIMDRIDIWVEVDKISHQELLEKRKKTESQSEKIKKNILEAREIQEKRFGQKKVNARMSARDIEKKIKLSKDVGKILVEASEKLDLSPRVFHKMIKLARTIADLEKKEEISEEHILEALQYRPQDII